jgi:hypothetical protein
MPPAHLAAAGRSGWARSKPRGSGPSTRGGCSSGSLAHDPRRMLRSPSTRATDSEAGSDRSSSRGRLPDAALFVYDHPIAQLIGLKSWVTRTVGTLQSVKIDRSSSRSVRRRGRSGRKVAHPAGRKPVRWPRPGLAQPPCFCPRKAPGGSGAPAFQARRSITETVRQVRSGKGDSAVRRPHSPGR